MTRVTLHLESAIFNQAAFRSSIRRSVTKAALGVEAEAKRRIQQGPKSGRVYRRGAITKKVIGAKRAQAFSAMGLKRAAGGKGFVVGFGFHRASAPGQSPASDTGHLATTIAAKPAQLTGSGITAVVTVNAKQGKILEEGGGRIAARPYLAPALRREEPKFQASLNALVAAAVR